MNILIVTEDHSIHNYGITNVPSDSSNMAADISDNIKVVIVATGNIPLQQLNQIPIGYINTNLDGNVWGWHPQTIKEF